MVAPMPVRHAISPLTASPRTDIIVDPMEPTILWELVRQRANQTLSELLLLVLFLVLTIVRFLRGAVGDIDQWDHVERPFLSQAQEGRTTTLPPEFLSTTEPTTQPPAQLSSSLPRSSPSASSLRPSVPSVPSVPYSLRPSAPALSVKPVTLIQPSLSPSPSPSPKDETITLTSEELLKELGWPASLDSFRILAKLGVVDESLLPPSPSPSSPSPSSPASTSPRPYVPPHVRRQPLVPRPSVPRYPVSTSSPDSPASSPLRPPLIRTFHHHLAVGTCHLNEKGELCLGPKPKHGSWVEPLPFWPSTIA
ncbi:hypothetical protein L207DRAFT_521423 [Hyaloscypha variabilis F]|uniref:Uncharacterized protein n=1 Tax=Hyaloscypha variabilis (strain UAMH 11265 / GT02V1 / F) TaxID=1149755 RepID=A0A2J6QR39_HYAVF|nr:hypothetical protein L207DRAFT_521423 [Hyaloscypha variabilis F]